jgi:hypothetical protein
MTTCEAVGNNACVAAATVGYLVFSFGWIVVTFALMQALLELGSWLDRFRTTRRQMLLFPPTRSRFAIFGAQEQSSSAAPAMPVRRVLAFAPKKTRNRLVMR